MNSHDRGAGASAALLALAASLSIWAAPARAALVEVAVTGVHDTRGHIRVDICTRDTFLKEDCPYSGEAPATLGSTLVTVAGVPPGVYAARSFHDETDQGRVHQNLLGIPREEIGFSNNAPVHIRGPRFSDAAFAVGNDIERITFKLRKLFGGAR